MSSRTIFSTLIFALLVSSALSQRTYNNEVISAINWARTSPKSFAALVNTLYVSKGIKGETGDPNCYSECVTVMNAQAPLPPLKENAAADYAAWKHSLWMANFN